MLNIQIPHHPHINIPSFENEIILPTKNLLQNYIDKVFQHLFQSFQEEHSFLIKTNKEYIHNYITKQRTNRIKSRKLTIKRKNKTQIQIQQLNLQLNYIHLNNISHK